LSAINTDSGYSIKNTSVETSARKVLHSTLFTVRALVYGIRCYLIEEGMISDIIPICDVEFSGVLIMDDLKSETKYNHREWIVIHYIFDVMYETKRV
jgi:hypothetical protein